MNNNENNENNEKFIDVESLPVDEGQQVAWKNCFQNNNYAEPKKKKRKRNTYIRQDCRNITYYNDRWSIWKWNYLFINKI